MNNSGVVKGPKLSKDQWYLWFEPAMAFLTSQVGRQANVLRDGMTYKPPRVKESDYMPEYAEGERQLSAAAKEKLRERAYDGRQKEVLALKEREPRLYEMLHAMLDDWCKVAVSAHEDFALARDDQDPAKLVAIMKAVLEKGGQSEHKKMKSKLAMRKVFAEFHQSQDMTTAAYKITYGQHRDAMKSLGDVVPEPAEDAEIFLSKLDIGRFGTMLAALDNQASMGMAKPDTVEKAYQIAIAWKTTTTDNKRGRGPDNLQQIFVLSDDYRPHKVHNDAGRGQFRGDYSGGRGGGGRNGGGRGSG